MNKESSSVLRELGLLKGTDVIVLSAQFAQLKDSTDKVENLRKEVKGEIKDTRKEINEIK